MKATFTQRFIAYLLDIIFIAVIIGIINSAIPKTEKYEQLLKEQEKITEEYTKGKIEMSAYLKEVKALEYNIDKESYNTTLIGLVISIGYFIIFQYLNKGQTLGKKIMKIRIRKREGELKLLDIIIRTLIINSIFTTIICLIAILLVNEKNYYTIKTTVSSIETIFVMISAFMILYKKDKLGLHDMITKTEVMKEG